MLTFKHIDCRPKGRLRNREAFQVVVSTAVHGGVRIAGRAAVEHLHGAIHVYKRIKREATHKAMPWGELAVSAVWTLLDEIKAAQFHVDCFAWLVLADELSERGRDDLANVCRSVSTHEMTYLYADFDKTFMIGDKCLFWRETDAEGATLNRHYQLGEYAQRVNEARIVDVTRKLVMLRNVSPYDGNVFTRQRRIGLYEFALCNWYF